MYSVESITCNAFWRTVHPAEKLGYAFLQVFLCGIIQNWAVSLFSVTTSLLLLFSVTRSQRLLVAKLIGLPFAFLIPASAAVAISWGGSNYLYSVSVSSFQIGISASDLEYSFQLFLRAFASSCAMVLVGLTTPVDHLEYILHKLRLPQILVELFGLIYRFIGLLISVFLQIQTAQQARGSGRGFRSRLIGAGLIAGALIRKAFWYQHWASLSAEARCYSGMQVYNQYIFSWSILRLLFILLHTVVAICLVYYLIPLVC